MKAQESITAAVSLSNATAKKRKQVRGLLKTNKLLLKIKTLCVQFLFFSLALKLILNAFAAKVIEMLQRQGNFLKLCYPGSKPLHLRQGRTADNEGFPHLAEELRV